MRIARSFVLSLAIATVAVNAHAIGLTSNNFDVDPQWHAVNNRTAPQNFGYTNTSFAGGSPGEIGGTVTRDSTLAFYADNLGPILSLEDPLFMSGLIKEIPAGSSSHIQLGWFRASTASHPPTSYLGLELSNSGIYIGFADNNGPLLDILTSVPAGGLTSFSLSYDPNAGANGRITFVGNGSSTTAYDLTATERSDGATFDHFGLFNVTVDGNPAQVFVDNLIYTAPEPSVLALLGLAGMMRLWRRSNGRS